MVCDLDPFDCGSDCDSNPPIEPEELIAADSLVELVTELDFDLSVFCPIQEQMSVELVDLVEIVRRSAPSVFDLVQEDTVLDA